tara:strand:- start:2122 stop:3216 length:1095 start_codon:yes stop_codon:yes gene_type:complete
MPYIQKWGVSRLNAVSPLNNNGFGPIAGTGKDSEVFKANFPTVDTDPDSDVDIIQQNNDISTNQKDPNFAKNFFASEQASREEDEEMEAKGFKRDPVNNEWVDAEGFDKLMTENKDDYRNRYFNIVDHSQGDTLAGKVKTLLTEPSAVLDKVRSFLPGATDELKERMKDIKGSNKDFFTGLRKTAEASDAGSDSARETLYGSGFSGGTNMIRNEAANWIPQNVAMQTGSDIGGNLRAAYEGGAYHPSGRVIPKEWSDKPQHNLTAAAQDASLYLPAITGALKNTSYGKKFNLANKIYGKLWKGDKGINTLKYFTGKEKSKDFFGSTKDLATSTVTSPSMKPGAISGIFGATTKAASWLANKFKD